MYHWKVYLWENGKKSTDYTEYTTAPIFIEDRLDETMDTGEIILKGMPISTRKAFPPKTKFRLERYLKEDHSDTPKKWDMVVEHDDVEEYEGCPEICTHRIHLIEASVIAQGMHVDNIALTYKLQDVTLNYKTVVSKTDTLEDKGKIEIVGKGNLSAVHTEETILANDGEYYFENSYNYKWVGGDDLRELKYEQDGREEYTIKFEIPKLMAQGCYKSGEWTDICEINTKTIIYQRLYNADGSLESEEVLDERICGPGTYGEDHLDGVYYVGRATGIGVNSSTPRNVKNTGIQNYSNTHTGIITSMTQFKELYSANDTATISSEVEGVQSKSVLFSTAILTEEQCEAGMYYEYEISCTKYPNPTSRLTTYYSRCCQITNLSNGSGTRQYMQSASDSTIPASDLYVNAKFRIVDLANYVEGDTFLASAEEYNCYNLVRKAMLMCDTQIFNNNEVGLDTIEYPIKISKEVADKLRACRMYETIFEQKNLWEILLQSGYYLHAIPYLEFAEDGTDCFELKYKQLGSKEKKRDTGNKITVFNSCNLTDYFTQYDSYVSNFFSPQNEVEEWGVVKTSDSSYLVSNNTAEIHLKYPIQEIVDFDIWYNSVRSESALNMIFEESVYSILTSDIDVRPSKACALYYTLGNNKIVGLNYTPPSPNNDAPYALKSILSALFGVNPKGDIKFNEIHYRIKYRTQDELRVSQVRPDLQNFMKNSSLEKYPHHEQFYGQQDKIVDSERFSANLWGKLIRVGNAVYQRQEQVINAADEKESGDLVMINDEPYYVTTVENEFYADVILQKVTYTKNFNQLSQIVTIPSEPRFYEVSEQSQVRREVRLMEFLLLTTKECKVATNPVFINNSKWHDIVKSIIFGEGSISLPNFAYTCFKADKKKTPNECQRNKLFPSSEVRRIGASTVEPKDSKDHRGVIVPLLHFPMKNAIVFEWDMDDNFKAGDSIDASTNGQNNTTDEAYMSMQSARYCDYYGRADLFNFRLFNKTNWTLDEMRRLPFAEEANEEKDEKGDVIPTEKESVFYLPDNLSIGLDKDNREALSFNYQLNLLQENANFVTYSNLFGEKSSRLKMCLLNTEVSQFDDSVAITDRTIIADDITYSLDDTNGAIEIKIKRPTNIDASAVKSIVLYEEEKSSKYPYIAKNVGDDEDKFRSWWIYPIFNS